MPAGKELRPLHSRTVADGDGYPAQPMPQCAETASVDSAEGHVDSDGRTPANTHAYEIRPTTVADEYEDGFNQYSRPRGSKAG